MKKIILVIALLCLSTTTYAQFIGDSPLTYSFTPTDGTVGIQRLTATIPFGQFSLGEGNGSIFFAGSYTYSSLNFANNKYSSVATSRLEHFHHIRFIAGYRRRINERWNLMLVAIPYIASDLRSELEAKDFRGMGVLAFQRTNETATSFWTLAVAYGLEFPFPIPLVSYRHIINSKWEYTIGIPRTELAYKIIPGGTIRAFIGAKEMNGNISTPVLENYQVKDTKLRREAVIGGLSYTQELTRRIAISLQSGYPIYSVFKIQNYDDDDLYDFNINKKPYFNISFKIDL